MSRNGIAGSYGGSIPSFLRNRHTILHSGWINPHSHRQTVQEHSFFFTPSPEFIVCRLFDDSHSDQCEVISHCSFDLHLSNNEWYRASFPVFISHLYVFGGRKKWQPTPVFLPRESCGQRSLVGCCLQGCTESDTTEATSYACMCWRRKWQPTPVFLPGEFQGQRSLVGCRLWGSTESDTTEAT